ncbi:MAG: CDP-diacylglycerol--glycerol-3-phosphate 3-phosphatidyltransferase [bacterium]
MNLPNSVTFLRILFIPLLVYFLLSPHIPGSNVIAVVIFVVVAGSDAVDGYLARRFKQETVIGKFMDPLADKILVISALLCLVEIRWVSAVPVMIIIARDLAVTGLRLAASSSGRIIAADMLGKYKTVLLDLAVAMLILNLPYGSLVLWIGVVLTVVSGIEYFIKDREMLSGRI